MPIIDTTGRLDSDGKIVSSYVDSVGSEVLYKFSQPQDGMRIQNTSAANIMVIVNGGSYTIGAGLMMEFSGAGFFRIAATSGVQSFEVTSWRMVEAKPVTRGNDIALMGDSITDQNVNYSCRGYLSWASILSNHQIRMGKRAATSGFTSQKILDTHLPTILNTYPRPNYCVVLAGTNDVGAVPNGSIGTDITTRNLTTIYDQLMKVGIAPVMCTIPPRADNPTIKALVYKLNTWIRYTAMTRGLPLVDFHNVLADANGVYVAGYDIDGIHPSKLGAKVMGAELYRVVSKLIPEFSVPICTFENTGNLFSNPLFLADSNSDGWPDGSWAKVAGTGTVAAALVPGPDVRGNWFSITKSDAPYAIIRNAGTTVIPGRKYAVSLRYKLESTVAATVVNIALIKAPNVSSTVLTSVVSEWSIDTDACTIYREFTVPDGVTSIQYDINFQAGTGKLSIGQSTLIDLTELGL